MIVIATQCFPPVAGGIEALMYSLACAFNQTGREVAVFADRSAGDDAAFDRKQTFTVRRYGGLKPWRRRRKAADLLRHAGKQGHDHPALIADSWKSLELVDTGPFAKVLCLAHGTEIPLRPSAVKLRRIRAAFSKADYVIANSNYTAGRLQTLVNDARRLRVILPGITEPPSDERAEHDIHEKLAGHDPVLITLARLEPRKGHLSVISILPRLINEFPALLYVIAGAGSGRGALEKAVTAAGLQAHVLFTDRLHDPEKSAWLKNSSLFIMPGKQFGQDVEGFGLAYIEAALQGLPAIACRVGGAPEAVLHRQTGLVCPADDAAKLAEVTLDLLRNRPYMRQLGMNARARARGFLWDNKIAEYLALLEPVSH